MSIHNPQEAVNVIKQNLLPHDGSLQWHDPTIEERMNNLVQALDYLHRTIELPQQHQREKLQQTLVFLRQVIHSYETGTVQWLHGYTVYDVNRNLHSITFWVEQEVISKRRLVFGTAAALFGVPTAIALLNWLLRHRTTPQLNHVLSTMSDEDLLKAMSIYQNPFRRDPRDVLATIRGIDLYGARRKRSVKEKYLHRHGWKFWKWRIRIRESTEYDKDGHDGLDLPTQLGTVIYPIAVGEVTEVRTTWEDTPHWRSGVVVKVRSPHNLVIAYAHLDENVLVRKGQPVTFTTPLARTGNTGNVEYVSNGQQIKNYCVHIGAWLSGREIDPLPLLQPGANFYNEVQKNPTAYLQYFRRIMQITA